MRQSLLFALLLHLPVSAQSWCAPGAEWEFRFYSQAASGITHATYTGDTIINGLAAQRIDHTIYAVNPEWSGQAFTEVLDPLFTRYDDDIVWMWGQWAGEFDTLMWFGAVPGDRWLIPAEWTHGGYTVVDTGHFLFGDDLLRWVAVEEDVAMYGPDTLWERIGFGAIYIDPWESVTIDYTTAHLKCYRDDSGNSFAGPWYSTPCQLTVRTAVHTHEALALPHPNPGTTHFALDLPPGPHTIELFDVTGRRVLHQRTTQERPTISTEHLPPGIYHLRVDDAAGVRWMKL